MRKYQARYRIKFIIEKRRTRRKKKNWVPLILLGFSLITAFGLGYAQASKASKMPQDENQATEVASATSTPLSVAPVAPQTHSSIVVLPIHGVDGVPSKEQKDIVARVVKKIYENRKDMIQAQGVSEGVFKTTAYYDILAMTFRESGFDCSRVGDQGRSRGCLQIQTALHQVSVEDAEDYSFAVEWTLDRMVRNDGYPHNRTYALQVHNGKTYDKDGKLITVYAEAVKSKAEEYRKMGL